MAFYGESFALFWGTTLSGSWSAFDDWTYHYDDAHHALASGDDVIVSSYADPADPVSFAAYPDPLEVRWVLEVLGGSGAVHLSGGLDPDWTFDDPADASQDLGTFTVSGATQVVSDPLTVSLADLVSADAAVIVRIQCTAGTVDVAQVKLRVWPAAGVGGAWVPFTGDSSTTANQVQVYAQLGANGPQPFVDTAPTTVPTQGRGHVGDSSGPSDLPYPDPFADDAALDAAVAARTDLAGKVGDGAVFGNTFTNSGSALSSSHAEASATLFVWEPEHVFTYLGDAETHSLPGYISAVLDFAEPNVPFADNPNPDEIADETQAYVRPVGGGDFTRTFLGWDSGSKWRVTFSAASAPESRWTTEPAVLQQHALAGPYEPDGMSAEWGQPYGAFEILSGGSQTVIPAGGDPGSPNQTVVDVAMVDSQHLAIVAQVPGVLSGATSELGVRDATFGSDAVHAYDYNVEASVYPTATIFRVGFGDLEVWDPAGVAASPRFFVKDLAGDWRPVGFGKPSTETAVFKVPTAGGMYRDLTTAEYATYGPGTRPPDGYPLKVKRHDDDGTEWWDHVAWMVPDA